MTRKEFLEMLLIYIGVPASKYCSQLNGCDIESGLDCSGFVNYVLKQAGYKNSIPRHANELFDAFGIFVHEEYVQTGDLVFFSRDGIKPTHVGIMISSEKYIHSPGKNNSVVEVKTIEDKKIISKTDIDYEIIYSHNPIGYKRITVKNGRYNLPFFMWWYIAFLIPRML